MFFFGGEAVVEGLDKFLRDFGGELGVFGAFFGEGEELVAFVGFVGKDLDETGVFEFADKDGCGGLIAVDAFCEFAHGHCRGL